MPTLRHLLLTALRVVAWMGFWFGILTIVSIVVMAQSEFESERVFGSTVRQQLALVGAGLLTLAVPALAFAIARWIEGKPRGRAKEKPPSTDLE